MGLADYQRKRNFQKTTEPAAVKAADAGWSYVIQKHAASHLHYDFRLEYDGVLKSWAVPKGPSLDPSVKRLAVQVEDHPVAYGGFEGTIPQGEYGGGTVLLWDRGTWQPVGDPAEGLREGKLKFTLKGKKLKGGWTLVRTRRSGSSSEKPQWLLIKERDDQARARDEVDILEEQPLSVASRRDLDSIAATAGEVWTAKPEDKPQTAAAKGSAKKRPAVGRRKPHHSADELLPAEKIDVQLATLVDQPPEGDEWVHEIKFDGYRMICHIDGNQIRMMTRNHHDWSKRLPELVAKAAQLSCDQAILDGEVVMVQPDGTTDFQALQNAFRDQQTGQLKYYVFDLLYLNGQRVSQLPLTERKEQLQKLLANKATRETILFSDHVSGQGAEFQKNACRMQLEGMISKRSDQPYRPGRGTDWLKTKCVRQEEFVIGGFTNPAGSQSGFGALLVGYYGDDRKLHYAGKVGTGYSQRQLQELHSRLKALEQDRSPFIDLQKKTGDARTAHWVEPQLVGQIQFGGRTRDQKLRHASFQGLREDKPARQVTAEEPVAIDKVLKEQRSSSRPAKRTRKSVNASPTAGQTSTRRPKKTSTKVTRFEYDSENETFAGVRLTHPGKILYPSGQITKLDIASYYHTVADWILPMLAHRPLVMVRCPEGSGKPCFYQKHPGPGTPDDLRQIPIQEENGTTQNYVVVDSVEGLIQLTQMGTLEIHSWGAREDRLDRPDRMIFDLDPDPHLAWTKVISSAVQIRTFLADLGLESFVKTTGGKGLHLVVPIERRHDWAEVKQFSKSVADAVVQANPSVYTANMSKAARVNKIYIDYLRNARGATAVAPYSTRAKESATVSMPLAWDELTKSITSDFFTIESAQTRLQELTQDPWHEFESVRQTLTGPIRKLSQIQGIPRTKK